MDQSRVAGSDSREVAQGISTKTIEDTWNVGAGLIMAQDLDRQSLPYQERCGPRNVRGHASDRRRIGADDQDIQCGFSRLFRARSLAGTGFFGLPGVGPEHDHIVAVVLVRSNARRATAD